MKYITRFFRQCAVLSAPVIAVSMTLSLGLASSASASPGNAPQVTLDWLWSGGGPMHYDMAKHSDKKWFDPNDNAWAFQGGDGTPAWGMEWDVQAADSGGGGAGASSGGSQFVNANLAVTNNTGQFQTFTALVTLTLPHAFDTGTLMSGSVSASVQDVGNDGAELRSAGSAPIYQAFIDGDPQVDSPVQTLLNAPYSLIAPAGGTESDSAIFGFPDPVLGPAAFNSISILLTFELSPFDTANVVGSFQIAKAPVPAPGALPLLAGLGLLMGARRRRN